MTWDNTLLIAAASALAGASLLWALQKVVPNRKHVTPRDLLNKQSNAPNSDKCAYLDHQPNRWNNQLYIWAAPVMCQYWILCEQENIHGHRLRTHDR